MMKAVLLFVIFSLFSLVCFACEVTLPYHLVILSDRADLTHAINAKNCDEKTIQELNQILNGVEGKVTRNQLSEMLSTKGQAFKINHEIILVQQLKQIVREQLPLPSGVQLRSTEAINAQGFISLAPGDKIEIQSSGNFYGPGQTLNVNIVGFDGANKNVTVRADFKRLVKAYRTIGFMPAFSNISSDMLKEEYVESIPHTDLVTDLETLKFYKVNKPIKANELLKQADLNAVNLVKAGLRTEVIIENELLRVKTNGISRSNGSLGETVEVFHAQKNKKYQGKVIDINKVLVEL